MRTWVLTILVALAPAILAQQVTEEAGEDAGVKTAAENPCTEFGIDIEAVLQGWPKSNTGGQSADQTAPSPAAVEAPGEVAGAVPEVQLSPACLEYLEAQHQARAGETGIEDANEKDNSPGGDAGQQAAEDDTESRPDDEDFKPDEEISEDYPVPLPSDI